MLRYSWLEKLIFNKVYPLLRAESLMQSRTQILHKLIQFQAAIISRTAHTGGLHGVLGWSTPCNPVTTVTVEVILLAQNVRCLLYFSAILHSELHHCSSMQEIYTLMCKVPVLLFHCILFAEFRCIAQSVSMTTGSDTLSGIMQVRLVPSSTIVDLPRYQ